ncbi:MAG: ribosome-associated protein [Vicingaceae bacterium]|jgi:ribosome-associated protein
MNSLKKDILTEVTFKTSRSGGKGGQHVNKTESRVSLFFNVLNSKVLTEEQIETLKQKLSLSIEGTFQVDCEASRSQLRNKDMCVQKFYFILFKSLTSQKKRRRTKPSKAAIRKRLKSKKHRAEIKQNRKFDY